MFDLLPAHSGQRAGAERGGAQEGDRVPLPQPTRGRGPARSGGGGEVILT